MAPINNVDGTIINREVRGVTWRQLAWLFGAFMCIEFTIVGMWFKLGENLDTHTANISQLRSDLQYQNDKILQLRVDVDMIKIHNSRADAEREQLLNSASSSKDN